VHILVVPRQHIESLKYVNASHTALLGHMMVVAANIARNEHRLVNGAYRISVNNGREAGQTVEHLHIHILGGEPLGRSCTTSKSLALDAKATPTRGAGDRA
jgi:histidine triad (HIT) family protein